MPKFFIAASGSEWQRFLEGLYFDLSTIQGSHYLFGHDVFGSVGFDFHGKSTIDKRAQKDLKEALGVSQKELHEIYHDKKRRRALQKEIEKMLADRVSAK